MGLGDRFRRRVTEFLKDPTGTKTSGFGQMIQCTLKGLHAKVIVLPNSLDPIKECGDLDQAGTVAYEFKIDQINSGRRW